MENINNFLTAIEKYGVPKTDLFQTVDLYEASNIPAVTATLFALGRIVRNSLMQQNISAILIFI